MKKRRGIFTRKGTAPVQKQSTKAITTILPLIFFLFFSFYPNESLSFAFDENFGLFYIPKMAKLRQARTVPSA